MQDFRDPRQRHRVRPSPFPFRLSTAQKRKARTLLSQCPGHRPGNDLLSRDLSSYYHWLLGA